MQAEHILPIRLQALRLFLVDDSVEQGLERQVVLAAGVVGAASCSVMLLGSEGDTDACMSIHAHHGPLPDAALQAAIRRGEGISGRVLATGKAVLVRDIATSEYAALARRGSAVGASLMSAPIRLEGRIAGVINAANGAGTAPFDEIALCMLEVVALFIGKSLQLRQLRYLLSSRFAQQALQREEGDGAKTGRLAYRNPEGVARILARSLFREMSLAGFGSAHVVAAASELIGQLHQDIQQEKNKDQGEV